ncbi:MAG TPA: OmpA family protein, partial [Elusimicrobiota bacterium]|nr:OmpA family protein [Elusimicrobiota bacterium]
MEPRRPFLSKKSRALALAAAFAATLSLPLAAYDERSRFSLGVEGGLALPAAPSDFSQNYKAGADLGGRIKQDLNERWSIAASISNQKHSQKEMVSQSLVTQPVLLLGLYSFTRTPSWTPYAALGLGVSRNTREVFARTLDWTKFSAAAGLGLEYNVSPLNTFGIEVLYRYFTRSDPTDKNFQTITVAAVVNFYLPDSWIPEKPRKSLVPTAPLEIAAPIVQEESSLQIQAQEELNQVQSDIAGKKIPPILFETGKAVILATSYETLDVVGTILRRYPQFSISVEGHTDSVGSDEANLTLSQARAEAVRAYIIQNFSL